MQVIQINYVDAEGKDCYIQALYNPQTRKIELTRIEGTTMTESAEMGIPDNAEIIE